jgi:hypothetical protein
MAFDPMNIVQLAKRMDGDGSMLYKIAEVVAKHDEAMNDAIWVESNRTASHVTSVRETQPSGTLRQINKGVSPTLSQVGQDVDYIGFIEDMSMVDDRLIRLAPKGQKQAVRSDEDIAHLKGLSETTSSYMFYGDRTVTPGAFDGFAVRRNRTGLPGVFNMAGSTAATNTSIFLVTWGKEYTHLIYPRGSKIGLAKEDFGLQVISDPNNAGAYLPMWTSWFYFDLGVVTRYPRGLARVVNINYAETMTNLQPLFDRMIEAINYAPNRGREGNLVAYMNEDMFNIFDRLAFDKTVPNVYSTDSGGVRQTYFRGVPLRRSDLISGSEPIVPAA